MSHFNPLIISLSAAITQTMGGGAKTSKLLIVIHSLSHLAGLILIFFLPHYFTIRSPERAGRPVCPREAER